MKNDSSHSRPKQLTRIQQLNTQSCRDVLPLAMIKQAREKQMKKCVLQHHRKDVTYCIYLPLTLGYKSGIWMMVSLCTIFRFTQCQVCHHKRFSLLPFTGILP